MTRRRLRSGTRGAASLLLLGLAACAPDTAPDSAPDVALDAEPRTGVAGTWEGEAETDDRPTFLRTVIAEPVGDHLDYWSEGGNITLPNSGLDAHFANGFHSYSPAPCPADVPCVLDLSVASLAPAIHVQTTWADYATGIDPVMSAIRTP